jgi:hypothetical protein
MVRGRREEGRMRRELNEDREGTGERRGRRMSRKEGRGNKYRERKEQRGKGLERGGEREGEGGEMEGKQRVDFG